MKIKLEKQCYIFLYVTVFIYQYALVLYVDLCYGTWIRCVMVSALDSPSGRNVYKFEM